MAKDFRASQVETSKLILSGGIASKDNLGAIVYSGSIASDRSGTTANPTLTTMLGNVGKDVELFVSGTIGGRDSLTGGAVLFGGDLMTSGSLIVSSSGETGGNISGSIHETYGGVSYLVAGTNTTITSASNGQITIASTGGASNAFSTISVAGQDNVVADASTDTLTLVAGSNMTLTTAAGSDTITFAAASGGSSEWTDNSGVLHPTDGSPAGTQTVVIGGTTQGNADIILGSDGGATFNEAAGSVDFRIESAAHQSAVLVDGGTNQVAMLSKGTSAANSYGLNSATTTLPTDIGVYISGSCGQAGIVGSFGTTVIAGDLIVSGNVKTIKCASGGGSTNNNQLELQPGTGITDPGSISVGSMDGNSVTVIPGGALVSLMPDDIDKPSLTVVNTKSEGVIDGASIGTIVGTTLDNNGGITSMTNVSNTSPSTFIEFVATENHTNTAGGGGIQLGGQTAGMNTTNAGKIWMELGSPGPFLPDAPYDAASNIAPIIQFGQVAQPVNLQMNGGYIYSSSPVKFSMSGSKGAAGFHAAYGNHLAMMITGSIYVSGSDAACGGTISGSIHHTRDGLSYLIGGTNVTIASSSNGQITINSSGGGGGSMSQFILEDDGGTELTINNDKEVKLIGGSGIKTAWTDTSTGSDADPYDMTLNVTGSTMTATYSHDGPHAYMKEVGQIYEGSNIHLANALQIQGVPGLQAQLQHDAPNVTHAVGVRTTVPKGATNVTIVVNGQGEVTHNGTARVELRIAARLHPQSGCALGVNTNSTAGAWTSSANDNGWIYFGNGAGLNTNATDKYISLPAGTPGATNCKQYRSPQFTIGSLLNNADDGNQLPGSIIDIIICRNASSNSAKLINDTSADRGGDNTNGYAGDFKITYIQLEYS